MKRGGARSIVFTPPATAVREARENDRMQSKATDPGEAVLLYGHMLGDVAILDAELRGLLFAADYRSSLRVVRGAARRLEERAARLLGEDK